MELAFKIQAIFLWILDKTICSEEFLYKVALPELKISSSIFFHVGTYNWFDILLYKIDYSLVVISCIENIEVKMTMIFNILDNTTELCLTIFGSGRATL